MSHHRVRLSRRPAGVPPQPEEEGVVFSLFVVVVVVVVFGVGRGVVDVRTYRCSCAWVFVVMVGRHINK